jgi:hypothetical protein
MSERRGEGNGAIATILHNVPEGGPASQAELGDESLQPTYSEEMGTSIGMHHGPCGLETGFHSVDLSIRRGHEQTICRHGCYEPKSQ